MKEQTQKPRFVIGIDPGSNTGWASWDRTEKNFVDIRTMSPAQTIIELHKLLPMKSAIEVVCEDARLRKWYGDADKRQARSGPGIREGVGAVKARCADIEEACKILGIPCRMVKPTAGASKWTADYFKEVTGWQGRTNEHGRDAAILVHGA
jgi:hypothetical protein